MYPSAFEYVRAHSVTEALDLLEQHGEDARPLAGGQSLIPLMKLRLATPSVLIDLNPIAGLGYVRERDGWLDVGPLARHVDLEEAEVVRQRAPIMHDAVVMVGDTQVRNLGTVAGAMAEADPGGDWGPVLLALGGEIACTGEHGERVIPASELFTDFYTTALAPAELITELRFRLPAAGSGGAYLKLERRAGDFAVIGVGVQLSLAPDGTCQDIGIGLSGVGATPIKAVTAEQVLRGTRLEEPVLAEALDAIDRAIDPASDTRAPADYRREMVGVYFRRALDLALSRTAS